MKLPNVELAYVPVVKLTDYLLSETHPVGRSKARFLRAHGFDETHVDLLAQLLIELVKTAEVQEAINTVHGVKYVVEGLLSTPSGKVIALRTVWIIDSGEQRPRFVTAYPT